MRRRTNLKTKLEVVDGLPVVSYDIRALKRLRVAQVQKVLASRRDAREGQEGEAEATPVPVHQE